MKLQPEIIRRLTEDFNFKTQNGYLRYGVCPSCHQKELFTSIDNPWILRCGRENKCGAEIVTKELYADLFNSWSERYTSTELTPNAAAEAYLSEGRGLDVSAFRGCFTQECYLEEGKGSATVRFALPNGAWWERIIDRPERFDRKANFRGRFAGEWWCNPAVSLDNRKELWITEGIFDALSLNQAGVVAVSIMTAGNYPEKALAALADVYKDKQRPVLVWALDNGNAGERAIKKHVQRSHVEGWQAIAAIPAQPALPGAAEAKPQDWNDLLLRNQLEPHHLKKYRHNGALLLAPNAYDKALLIFEYTERQEFHFEYDSRLFWFKLDIERHMKAIDRIMDSGRAATEDLARRMALKESGAIKEIANCYPVPLYFQRSEPTDEAWYYLRVSFPGRTPPAKGTFTAAQLSSASEFKKRLLHVAKGAIYTGNTTQLDRLIRQDLPVIKEVKTQNFIGYNKEWGAWVFNEFAVRGGRVYALNSEDYFELDGSSVKSLSTKPELRINPEPSEFITTWIDDVWSAFGVQGYVALAFWLGSLFAEQVRGKYESYPFLEIVGEPGTGKSTLIDFLWRLCGRDDYEGFDPSKATNAGRSRNFAQVANLPVVLIEGDRDDGRSGAFDFNELKNMWNGRGVVARGVKSNNNETYEPRFKGSLVIAQNAVVEASPAVMERIVHIFTSKANHNEMTREAAERLEQIGVEKVSGFILRATCKEQDIMGLVEEVYPQVNKALLADPDIRHVRIAKNHAQIIAFVRALGLFLPIPDDRLQATCDALHDMARQRVSAIGADAPIVREFWEAFDYLNDSVRYGVNHYGENDEGLIAVSFPHLMQEAALSRVQFPPLNEVKNQLKAGKQNVFVGVKAVRSAVSKARNTGVGMVGDHAPEIVRCWIFKRNKNR